MKILVILAGTPIRPSDFKHEDCLQIPTLTQGMQTFRFSRMINNWQTLQSLIQAGQCMGHQVDFRSFSNRKNPIHLLRGGLVIRKLVKERQYDIVHIFWGGASAFVASLFCPCPVVVSLMGSDLLGDYDAYGRPTWFGKLLAWFSQNAVRRAQATIVMSAQMKSKLWRKSQPKCFVLPEGFDPEKFFPEDRQQARKTLGWDAHSPVVVYFNSGRNVKNARLAHQVFALVHHQVPEARLKELADIPHQQLRHYYNAADVLLHTSLHEGSNNSIKEALACNCPLVCTPAGDAPERLQGVQPSFVGKDWQAAPLAEAVSAILLNPMRSNGRSMVLSLALPNIARQIFEIYQSIMPTSNCK